MKSALKKGSHSSATLGIGKGAKAAEERRLAALEEARVRAAEKRKRQDRRDGIVRGHDGRPMKRLADGRTVVRALDGTIGSSTGAAGHKRTFDGGDDEEEDALKPVELEEAPLDATAADVDPLQSKPNAHARAFLKSRLRRKGGVIESPAGTSASLAEEAKRKRRAANKTSGPKKTYDDPLGLEDPFLMKGGAYAKEGGTKRLKGAASPHERGPRQVQGRSTASRGGGGRIHGALSE